MVEAFVVGQEVAEGVVHLEEVEGSIVDEGEEEVGVEVDIIPLKRWSRCIPSPRVRIILT